MGETRLASLQRTLKSEVPVSLFPHTSLTSYSTESFTTALSTRRVRFTASGKGWLHPAASTTLSWLHLPLQLRITLHYANRLDSSIDSLRSSSLSVCTENEEIWVKCCPHLQISSRDKERNRWDDRPSLLTSVTTCVSTTVTQSLQRFFYLPFTQTRL